MKIKTQSFVVINCLLVGIIFFTVSASSEGRHLSGSMGYQVSNWIDDSYPLVSGANHENHRGSAWIDSDNDGLLDLYLTHFGVFDPDGEYVGSPNQFLQNLGDGLFEDVTAPALEANSGLSHHAAFADIDNNGLPDLYVSQSANTDGDEISSLICQTSLGVFNDITSGDPLAMAGILPRNVAWQDVNNDGYVDLLVANSGGLNFRNRLMINQGNNTFVKQNSVLEGEFREGRGIAWCDYNNDSLPDVYVSNGAEDHADVLRRKNQLFRNNGDGTWTDVADQAGVSDVGHGRGVSWGDINNDGHMDLFVGNQKGSDVGNGHNKFYRNNGDGTFTDITLSSGLYGSFRTRCVSMADYDNDGFLDLYVVNFGGALPPNHLFRNNGNETFTEVAAGTLAAGSTSSDSSASWADYNNDGWVDLYLVGGSPDAPGVGSNVLLRNNNQNGNHWLEVELCGVVSNQSAIGARVTIRHRAASSQLITQTRDIQSGSSYNSTHMLRAHFGIGESVEVIEVQVNWPSGIEQIIESPTIDRIIRIVEDPQSAFDCNRNCVPDSLDIFAGTSLDENGNGIPDECDCFGDVNGDGVLDVNDLIAIIVAWGSLASSNCDLNDDGIVEVNDIVLFISYWGTCD